MWFNLITLIMAVAAGVESFYMMRANEQKDVWSSVHFNLHTDPLEVVRMQG